jgi:hypothetical protein
MINIKAAEFKDYFFYVMWEHVIDEYEHHFYDRFYSHLTEGQRSVQDLADKCAYDEGKWYRRSHNLVVCTGMRAIINADEAPEFMYYSAPLHDIGYDTEKLSKGDPDWEKLDVRVRHMRLGKDKAKNELMELRQQLGLNKREIREIARCIGEHDNPYINLPILGLTGVLRSADRCFVPSVTSYYKDMVSYLSSPEYMDRAEKLGMSYNPDSFFDARVAFFFEDESPFDREFRPDFASFNEGGGCEPCYTETERLIVTKMLQGRLEAELSTGVSPVAA